MVNFRPCIGFGIDYLSSPYHAALFRGVEDACQLLDADLICLVTGRLDSALESEKCRNVLLHYIGQQAIDGLVFAAGPIGNLASDQAMSAVLNSFGTIPLAMIGTGPGDYGLIKVPGGIDLSAMVKHLVHDHAYTKLAYCGGSRSNHESQGRLSSFKQACQSYNIQLRPEWIFEGDFRPESGRRAVLKILSESKSDLPQALVCANDAMAWGAMECLRENGIAPGWDMAITGYDDSTHSDALGLTSLRQDFEEEARQACIALINTIRGNKVNRIIHVSEKPVIRQSCGCRSLLRQHLPDTSENNKSIAQFEENTNLFDKLLRLASLYAGNSAQFVIESTLLIDTCLQGVDSTKRQYLEERALEIIHNSLKNNEIFTSSEKYLRLEEITDRAEEIASCFEREHLGDILSKLLPDMNIKRFILSTYIIPGNPQSGLMLEASNGIDFNGPPLEQGKIWPDTIFAKLERRTYLVHALFHGFDQIGIGVFSTGARDLDFYDQLRIRISLALKGSRLVGELRSYAQSLEDKVGERTAELNRELEVRRRTELDLRRSEEQIRNLATLVPGIMLELDHRLNIRFINNAGLKVLGCRQPAPGQAPIPFIDCLSESTRSQAKEYLRGILAKAGNESCQTELHVQAPGKQGGVLLVNISARGSLGSDRGLYLSAMDLNPLLDSAVSPHDIFHTHYHLSPRVREVFELMIRGLAINDIADRLGIAVNTVKVHIHTIYMSTGTKNRKELFVLLREYQERTFGYGSYLHSLLAGVIQSDKPS